jgi:predicted nucleotide-binding protein
MNATVQERWESRRRQVSRGVGRLKTIRDKLELIDTVADIPNLRRFESNGKDVFVVHGHDEAAKQTAARLIERLGYRPIVLHEQPNLGRTVIEKFEQHSEVAFALVLLTQDDVGGLRREAKPPDLTARERQNVVLELGYFIGKLGRSRVCAVYDEKVELPSDLLGIAYIPLDGQLAWTYRVATEMRAAGLDIDMNKVV